MSLLFTTIKPPEPSNLLNVLLLVIGNCRRNPSIPSIPNSSKPQLSHHYCLAMTMYDAFNAIIADRAARWSETTKRLDELRDAGAAHTKAMQDIENLIGKHDSNTRSWTGDGHHK